MEYKVAIIDDEHDVRQRLIRMLDGNEFGFIVTQVYDNGADALEGLTQRPVDLIITDIKIPFIEGTELIRKIKESIPDIKTVFITGYNEIDYAKQAIDLETLGFISKPISKSDIDRMLYKAKRRIENDVKINSTILELDSLRKANLPILKENDLYRLMQTNVLTDEMISRFMNSNLNLNYEYFMIGVFDFDVLYDQVDHDKTTSTFITLKRFIEINLKDIDFDFFKRGINFVILLKSNLIPTKSVLENVFHTQIERIHKYVNVSISVGFSKIFTKQDSFRQMFHQAKNVLHLRAIVGGKQVLFHESNSDVKSLTIDKNYFNELNYLIRYGSIEAIKEYIKGVNDYLAHHFRETSFYLFLIEMINKIVYSCDSIDELARHGFELNAIYRYIYEVKTVELLHEWLVQLINAVKQVNSKITASIVDKNLFKIDEYIKMNYDNKDISLEKLSESVGLSQSYISSLLKKEHQTSFVKIVTQLRMEKAKELLLNPNNKIIDVADTVGYHEAYYFSHCFKKYVGKSPKEFRNANG